MSYTINIDPKNPLITKAEGVTVYDGGANGGAALANDKLAYPKYNTFSSIFNQYRVNVAMVKIRVDSTCGLENSIIVSNDKGNASAVETMAIALTGAHRSYSLSDARRELKYQIKNTGQDKDYLSTSTSENQVPAEKRYIKVFQKIPKGENATLNHVCEHQIQVMLSLTLKDSKNITGTGSLN
jgi:hypothetical protein